MLTGDFAGCETSIRRGIELVPEHPYFYTNLPPALLLQGKEKAAIQEYKKWKDKPFTPDENYANYDAVFLSDLAELEKEGVIPAAYKDKVAEVIQLLQDSKSK